MIRFNELYPPISEVSKKKIKIPLPVNVVSELMDRLWKNNCPFDNVQKKPMVNSKETGLVFGFCNLGNVKRNFISRFSSSAAASS